MKAAAGLWLALAVAEISPAADVAVGVAYQARVTGSESASFTLRLDQGQTAWGTVRNAEADVRVRIRAPGVPTATIDVFDGHAEPVLFTAERSADHLIEIQCASPCPQPVNFEFTVVSIHTSSPVDELRRLAIDSARTARSLASEASSRKESLQSAEDALRLWRTLREESYEVAAMNTLGTAQYLLGRHSDALQTFRESLVIARRIDDPELTNLISNAALCQWRLGAVEEALELLFEAQRLRQQAPLRTEGEAVVLSNLGILHCQIGECHKAISYYLESIRILTALNLPAREAVALHNLGAAYGMLGDNQSASEYIGRSLPLFRRAKDRLGEGRALVNLGFVRLEQRRLAEARQLHERARALIGEQTRDGANLLTNLCKIETAAKNLSLAVDLCRQATDRYRKLRELRGEANALHALGAALTEHGENEKALSAFGKALELRRAINIPSGLAETLTYLARLEMERGRTKDAVRHAAEAIDVIESLRARVTAERLRSSYFAMRQAGYDTYIEILMRLHQLHPEAGYNRQAFHIAERRRARTLLDLLQEDRNEMWQTAASADLDRRRTLLRRLSYLTNQKNLMLARTFQPAEERILTTRIDEALRELERIEAQIRDGNLRFADLTRISPASLSEVQQELDADSVLLEYYLGVNASYLWVITRDSLKSFTLPRREELETTVRRVVSLAAGFRNRQRSDGAGAQLRGAVHRLRRQLLQPVSSLLGSGRLVIVADGALESLPFALIAPPRHELISLPSASTLVALRKQLAARATPPLRAAVLADPVFDSLDPRVQGRSSVSTGPELARLPFSRREADAIAALVPEQQRLAALDFRASRATLLSPELKKYSYIHISTHALVNTNRPELSSLVLSRVDEAGASRDGEIRLYEIYNLDLAAELVVLSACSTGVGKEVRGEGLIGFTRGFLFAGARSVLVTLWPVEDEATAVFMREFYTHLFGKVRLSPAAALRRAQRALSAKKRWQDPYFWAGFVLQGDWQRNGAESPSTTVPRRQGSVEGAGIPH